MKKILSILKKDILVLLMSKWWVLVVVIGPLLVIFLSGIAFDNFNEYRLNIGIYSPTYNEITNSFISKLNSDQFRTVKAQSETECIDFIKLGVVHTCIIFPADLTFGASNKNLKIFIDYSKLNLAWVVRDRLFSKVEERSTEITKQLTDNLLSKLLIVKKEITNDIPLIVLLSDSENNVTRKTADALLVVGNTTYRLNMSQVDRVESMANLTISTYWKLLNQSRDNLQYANMIVLKSDYSDERANQFYSEINKRRAALSQLNSYIDWLYSSDYTYSINNTIGDLRLSTTTSNNVISVSEDTLKEVYGLSDFNNKIIKRLKFSFDNADKELKKVDEFSADDIAAPVSADIEPISAYNTNLNYVFPTLMAMSIMLAAMLLSTIIVVMELNSPAYFRNVISPVKDKVFFFASYLTNLIIIFIEIALMIIMSMFFFFSQVAGNIINTLSVCFLIATFFIILGMGIGYLFRREQISILAATFTSSIFLFLSNMLVPIENMPVFFTKIVQFNPFIISVSLLRKTLLFNQSLISVYHELFYLILLTLGLLVVYWGVSYIRRK